MKKRYSGKWIGFLERYRLGVYLGKIAQVSDKNLDVVLSFINRQVEKLGTVLPLDRKSFFKYFPPDRTFIVLGKTGIESLFVMSRGRGKGLATLRTRIYAQDEEALEEAFQYIKKAALTMEAMYIRTAVFSYAEECSWLPKLGFEKAAVIPEIACLQGNLYDLIYYYYDLKNEYSFRVEREYVDEELYKTIEVEKKRDAKIVVRGLRLGDLDELEWALNHINVFATLGSGFYEGLVWWDRDRIVKMVFEGRLYPLVAQDASNGRIVGMASLEPLARRSIGDVLSNAYSLAIFVAAEYQGMGVGSKLMKELLLLAKRLHARMLTLEVFENNFPAIKLYEKYGFVKAGRLPIWIQKGYVWSLKMYKRLYSI